MLFPIEEYKRYLNLFIFGWVSEKKKMEELGNKAPPNPVEVTPLGADPQSNRH